MNSEAVVPVAATFRNEMLESLHHGVMVILNRHGNVDVAVGDCRTAIFPRSCLKPLQTYSMICNGLELPDENLALVCASHNGTARHLAGVKNILQRAGLDESALANTPDLPLGQREAEEALRAGASRTSLQQNCSGKHAGMLATCRVRDWPSDKTYLSVEHPLQREIITSVEFLAAEPVTTIGVDGCGAPTHALSVIGLARAFRYLALENDDPSARSVFRAMTTHPEMVGGPGHVTTRLMQNIPGLLAKDGAEGVFALALSDGRAMALKVADGANRVRPPLIRAALHRMGVDVGGIDAEIFDSPVLGHGERVGEVRIVGEGASRLRG